MKPEIIRALLTISAIILAAGGCARTSTTPSMVTFNKDIAPIVFENCAPCHRPGQAAPFSLLTYADAVEQAQSIADVTLNRYMPRWLAEDGEFPILDERRLSEDQIDTIQRWVNGGTVEGNAADLPAMPSWTDGWELGQPDVALTVDPPYLLDAGPQDTFRYLVLRTPLNSDVFVRAVEFKASGAPIHHAVIRLDRTSGSRRRDGRDGQPGFDGMAGQGDIQDPDGQFVGWAPGRGPIVSPEGMPWRLDRGADLVIEVHVPASDTPFAIQPTLGLFLTDTPPVQTPLRVMMETKLIDIPAGERDYVLTDTYELPVPVDLLSVFPHAHYLGKEMLVTATLPDGDVWSLLHIPQWDFRWQQDYRYATPIPLPRGTTLTMRYTYDNSDENVANPNSPPVRVQWEEQSTDEMAELGMQVLTKSPEDGARLVRSFRERDLLANVAMAEARVREAPDVARNRALLGGGYADAGRFADAIPHLEAALRLEDQPASTYSSLGLALGTQGRLADALVHLERATALDPLNEVVHFELANAFAKLSRFAEAEAAYEQSLAINPDFPDAHINLGISLYSRGRIDDALAHFERAVALRPDSPVIAVNLGNALADAGRFAEAMPYLEAALRLDGSATTHSSLGVAIGAQGRLADALAHFERAAELDPLNEVTHFDLANAFARLSRFAQAEAAYEQSLAINPDFPDAHINLGISLHSRGRIDDALAHFERAVALRPDSAVIAVNLGNALADAGRFAEAMPHIQRALQLEPDFPPALDTLRRLQQLGPR